MIIPMIYQSISLIHFVLIREGLLVRKGGVNRHLVVYLIGDVGIRLWLMLEKYIKEERDRRGDRFWHAGFEYLVMLSLKSHLKTSRGVVKIYHPDDRTKEEPYTKEKLIEKLQDIEVEMLIMPGGLGMSFGDLWSIFRHRPFLFFTWARVVFLPSSPLSFPSPSPLLLFPPPSFSPSFPKIGKVELGNFSPVVFRANVRH